MMGLIKKLRSRTPLGWLQLKYDRGRLLTALSGIAFADILMFMQLGVLNALFYSNTMLHRRLEADIVLINTQALNWSEMSTFARRRLYQAMDVPGVKSADALYINNVRWKNPQTGQKTSVMVMGTNPDRPAFDIPEVNQNLDIIKLPDTVFFDRGSRGEYAEAIAKIDRGETVTTEIERRTITVGGLFELGASFAADAMLITSDSNFLRLFPKKDAGTVSIGLIQVESGYDIEQVKNSLNAHLGKSQDVKAMSVEELIDFEIVYWAKNRPVGIVFGFGTIMGFVVGVVIVYQVLSTDVNDHMAEYATFKAMGYKNSYLLGVVFEEAIILALLGFIPGVGISIGLYNLVSAATALPLFMPSSRAIMMLALTILMCGISGAIATRKLQSADPADIF
ncbi:MAG: ABC transporter permease DevC [Prochloraceae cyanobacterium]|nr:ABC transporter permease DevC [Prochloraceae cyanobacterium]